MSLLLAATVAGCSSGGSHDPGSAQAAGRPGTVATTPPGATGPPSDPITGGPALTPTTSVGGTHPTLRRPRRRLDFGGSRILPGHIVVAYYGTAGTPALGVLGDATPGAEWSRLLAASRPFATPRQPAIPAYELIADVEQGSPGPRHDYVHRLSDPTIASYLRVVHRHHGLLILDIQPGRNRFLSLAEQLRHFLLDPDVGLALDVEWRLGPHQVPDRQIGHSDAFAINRVSAWLSRLVRVHRLPQKLFVIHQFSGDQIGHKRQVRNRPGLASVFNMDGFGPPGVKRGSYRVVDRDTRLPLGFKLFYKQDPHRLSPRRVLSLHPQPVLVEYQ